MGDHDLRNLFFKRNFIDPHVSSVTKACRDSYSHASSRELVPLGELLQDRLDILEDEHNYKDNLLPLVVDWFSSQFFEWFKPPSCERCSTLMGHRNSYPNQEGKLVEHYACDNETCDSKFDFIRHNEPAILLHTRTGRCGEWAMCFFIILRSLDYETRLVYDSTDHVWNEVWSEAKGRWIHVDPCENVVDTPLLYEVGWSKKLEYCIAFGQYEVSDVTKRYAINFHETKTLRTACDESWLAACLDRTTEELLLQAPSDDIRTSIRHKRCEDSKFLNSPSISSREIPDKSELAGRKTGSVQWRIARGEYKPSAESKFVIKVESSFSNDLTRAENPLFGLYYNSAENTYKSTLTSCDNVKNWSSLTYEYQNLDFKYERDWKISYVARYETCPHDKIGTVRWRYDLTELSDWKSMKLYFLCQIYPGTSIRISLKSLSSEHSEVALDEREISFNSLNEISRQDLHEDATHIDLIASLEGGDAHDEVAWQKPQLFRQARDHDPKVNAMSVEFY